MTKPITKLNVQPLHDRVIIVAPNMKEEKKAQKVGLIFVPESTSDASRASMVNPYLTTEVLAVGGDCKLVKAGQRVVVAKGDCFTVTVDGVEHAMVREGNLVAVVP